MLKSLPEIKYQPLLASSYVKLRFDGRIVQAQTDRHTSEWSVTLQEDSQGTRLCLQSAKENPDSSSALVRNAVQEYLLGHHRQVKGLEWDGQTLSREEYLQKAELWLNQAPSMKAEKWVYTADRFHPERPPHRPGVCYRRYIPETGRVLSLRLMDLEKDLNTFHEWHNQQRVYNFWELNKSKEELRDYMVKGLADPHQIPMILEIDGESVGYFEMYWVAEDRLAPYYDCEAFDRGFHFLIGNEKFLGFENTDAALRSAVHFLFLDDPRTRRIMAEPRSDNIKVLRYVETFTAWRKVKEFDFPHKRAALLECRREKFFHQGSL